MYILIVCGVIFIGAIIMLLCGSQMLRKSRQRMDEEYMEGAEHRHAAELEQYKAEIGEAKALLNNLHHDIDKAKTERDLQIDSTEHVIEQLNRRKEEITAANDELIAEQSAHTEDLVRANYDKTLAAYQADLVSIQQNLLSTAKNELDGALAEGQAELSTLRAAIDDYRAKQQIINEEILRRREIEEQQDFYRVCLSEHEKKDIQFFLSILDKIENKQPLYKLIWSEYLQKPFNEMVKRVLAGKECKYVIYKITNLKSGEIYIGRTRAEVSKRWTEHIKTSLNIGTIARSKIHTALFDHWDEFSFEVLEKVEDETLLSSREKFYINFYQSNIYGYNLNSGG